MAQRDIEVIRRNVAKLAHKGADQSSIDKYVSLEGYDPSKLYDGEGKPPAAGTDPRIEKEMRSPGRIGLDMAGEALKMSPAIQMTESMTNGASEDLLPLAGQLVAGGAAGAATKSPIIAMGAAGAGAGAGEILRQGVRQLRGKSTENAAQDVAKETLYGAGSELGARAIGRGLKISANTKYGRATINAFGKAMSKAATLGQKGQKAVMDVLNFMGDLHPGSVDYAVKRGPANLFRPENFDKELLGRTAKDVTERIDQMNVGARKMFDITLKDFYKSEYLRKYPFIKRVLPQGIDKIKSELRFQPWRVVDAGEKAMKEFGYTNRLGTVKPTILAKLGNKMDEGERLKDVLDHVRSFKHMTPDDAMTLREELNNIIYDGWKDPKTKVHISEATGSAKSVLKTINKELSDRLHTRIPGLKPIDEAFQQAKDIARRAKPFYGDTVKGEKFMRKYHAVSKGTDTLTAAEKQLIDDVDSVVPHKQKVLDHLYAKEFEPVISNFWKSRALASLVGPGIGGLGFAAGGPVGIAAAEGAALAVTSPRVIQKGLKAAEKISRTTGKVTGAAGKAISKATPAVTKTLLVQGRRERKNAKEQ